MDIARRLRELREAQNMSQGDVEAKTGLLRVYISRIENGHTTPRPKRWRKLLAHSGFRYTQSSTKAMICHRKPLSRDLRIGLRKERGIANSKIQASTRKDDR